MDVFPERHEVWAYDVDTNEWTRVGDPIHGRLALMHGTNGGSSSPASDVVWAIESGELTQLLAPSTP